MRVVQLLFAAVALAMCALPGRVLAATCYEDPSQTACHSFTMNATEAVGLYDDVCETFPGAVGCDIGSSCAMNAVSGAYCDPVSLLLDLCLHDSPDVAASAGCTRISQLCASNSQVAQCENDGPVPMVPSTADAVKGNLMMCEMMPDMPQCEQCTGKSATKCPQPLLTLSAMCLDMNMMGCESWADMCAAVDPAGFELYCGSHPSHPPPQMIMYFHFGIREYFLLQNAVSESFWGFLGGNVVLFLMALTVTYVKMRRVESEKKWKQLHATHGASSSSSSSSSAAAAVAAAPEEDNKCGAHNKAGSSVELQLGQQLLLLQAAGAPEGFVSSSDKNMYRAMYTLVISSLDFVIMLAVMTFNVVMLLSVVLGLATGQLLWGHIFSAEVLESATNGNADASCCA